MITLQNHGFAGSGNKQPSPSQMAIKKWLGGTRSGKATATKTAASDFT